MTQKDGREQCKIQNTWGQMFYADVPQEVHVMYYLVGELQRHQENSLCINAHESMMDQRWINVSMLI